MEDLRPQAAAAELSVTSIPPVLPEMVAPEIEEPEQQPAEPSAASSPRPRAIDLSRLTALLFGLVALWLLGPYFAERLEYAIVRGRQRAEVEVATASLPASGLEALSLQYQMVSKRVGPSVVHISVTSNNSVELNEEPTWRYRWEARGQGSGVIVDPGGYILTNYHVIQGASDIQVVLSEGRKLPAELAGKDAATDLALLKVKESQLIAAEWGDSDRLDVGALVWAVGSPFGLQRSITCGILSAKNRAGVAGRIYQDLLQTDAAVNPGNSGGPLVDAQGRVIGINTAIMGESYQGISFAIPSSVARQVYERLRASGHVDRGWLGVALDDVDEDSAQRLRLQSPVGARIAAVYTDGKQPSPAQRAGLQADDVLLRWNSIPVSDATSLSLAVAQTEVGSTAQALVVRHGRQMTIPVVVGARPDNID